jgi:hypothetical protein
MRRGHPGTIEESVKPQMVGTSTLSLTSALDGGGSSTPRPGSLRPRKIPDTHFTGRWVGSGASLNYCGWILWFWYRVFSESLWFLLSNFISHCFLHIPFHWVSTLCDPHVTVSLNKPGIEISLTVCVSLICGTHNTIKSYFFFRKRRVIFYTGDEFGSVR